MNTHAKLSCLIIKLTLLTLGSFSISMLSSHRYIFFSRIFFPLNPSTSWRSFVNLSLLSFLWFSFALHYLYAMKWIILLSKKVITRRIIILLHHQGGCWFHQWLQFLHKQKSWWSALMEEEPWKSPRKLWWSGEAWGKPHPVLQILFRTTTKLEPDRFHRSLTKCIPFYKNSFCSTILRNTSSLFLQYIFL